MSRGKAFEREVVKSLRHKHPGSFVERFTDGMYGQASSVKTPPDIIYVHYVPNGHVACLVECKSTKQKSIRFDAVSPHQWEHLAKFPGRSYVAINFCNGERGKKRVNRAWMMPFDWFHREFVRACEEDRKSMNMSILEEHYSAYEMTWKDGVWKL